MATLDFGNVRRMTEKTPQLIFGRLPIQGAPGKEWRAGVPVEALRSDQETLKDWLTKIANLRQSAYPEVAPQINEKQDRPKPVLTSIPVLREGKLVHIITLKGLTGVEGVLAYGTALILDPRRGLTRRLGRCNYCGRFRLDFEGRPRTYCSDAHRLAYDRQVAPERVRMWRKRREEKEEEAKAHGTAETRSR